MPEDGVATRPDEAHDLLCIGAADHGELYPATTHVKEVGDAGSGGESVELDAGIALLPDAHPALHLGGVVLLLRAVPGQFIKLVCASLIARSTTSSLPDESFTATAIKSMSGFARCCRVRMMATGQCAASASSAAVEPSSTRAKRPMPVDPAHTIAASQDSARSTAAGSP